MSKTKKLIIWIVFAGALIASGVSGFLVARQSPSELASAANGPADLERVAYQSTLEITYEYIPCGHSETVITQSDMSVIGKNKKEIAAAFAGMQTQIKECSQEKVRLNVRVEEYCERHFILAADSGKLSVFQGSSKGGARRRLRELTIEDFPNGQWVFQTNSELYEFLSKNGMDLAAVDDV